MEQGVVLDRRTGLIVRKVERAMVRQNVRAANEEAIERRRRSKLIKLLELYFEWSDRHLFMFSRWSLSVSSFRRSWMISVWLCTKLRFLFYSSNCPFCDTVVLVLRGWNECHY